MPAFKVFITFNKQFWKEIGENRQYEVGRRFCVIQFWAVQKLISNIINA